MNDKLSKLIERSKQDRGFLEAKESKKKTKEEKEEEDKAKKDAENSEGLTEEQMEGQKGRKSKDSIEEMPEEETKEENGDDDEKKGNKYILSGVVKRILNISEKDESGSAKVVAVVRVPAAKAFNVMGRNIKISSGSIIPIVTTGAVVGDKVTLEFNVSKLLFEISETK